ncbi:MAG: regulatory protein RecX [Ignavibacteriales bacterium]|nr:regulatory protein RecX [Ignavibacteriales bacterium]
MKILDIKKKGNLYTIIFDSNDSYNVHLEIIIKNNLKIQDDVDNKFLKKILEENDLINTKNSALFYLARRQHSRSELFLKLMKKKYSKVIIERALNDLENSGFINDREFTKSYIQELVNKKREGINKIRNRLFSKGINKEIIDEELKNIIQTENILDNALILAKKKINILSKNNLSKEKIRQKLFSYLVAKGYNYELVSEIIKICKLEEYRDD